MSNALYTLKLLLARWPEVLLGTVKVLRSRLALCKRHCSTQRRCLHTSVMSFAVDQLPFIIFFFVFVIAWSPCMWCTLRVLWKRSDRHVHCSTCISKELPSLVFKMNSKAHSAASVLQHLQRHTWTVSIHISLLKWYTSKMTPPNRHSARIPTLCKSWIKCICVASTPFSFFFFCNYVQSTAQHTCGT